MGLAAWLVLTASAAAAPQVSVLGLFKDRALLKIDGKRILLKVGETAPGDVRLIAADSEHAVIAIGGVRQTRGLDSEVVSAAGGAVSAVRLYPDAAGLYLAAGTINRRAVRFIVDTGASSVALGRAVAEHLDIDITRSQPVTAHTASGAVSAYRVRLDSVTLGAVRLYDVEAVILDGAGPPEALLGMSFLSRVHMQREGAALIIRTRN